ncbi:DinB family protein [Oceanobacillus halophilus]|uniref:Damage-inducible protein DinB n=1 Tax=Oceanobacillus halophilus TaxID=930130 RepID=A0A494ZXJ5_9BACI|nr:DinB family protein [Oceanobacillus halophilus]RKQ30784.1 damage-inducible protein DinB [Oceanobacillus halophilus]
MYRKVEDFLQDWSNSSQGTLQVLESITDEKLGQAIVEGHSTLGWLGWHLATAPAFFAGLVGLEVKASGNPSDVPAKASEIAQAYKKITEDVKQAVEKNLTDEKLEETVDSFGKETPRGVLLRTLIDHQTHHRGQMTVLLRQAGLPVPGVMGPTKEEQAK